MGGTQPQQTALSDRAQQAAAVLLPVVGAEARRAVAEAEVKLAARQLRAAAARNKRRTIKQQQQEGAVGRLQLVSRAR